MKKSETSKYIMAAAVLLLFLLAWLFQGAGSDNEPGASMQPESLQPPRRIISMVPSTTEILFALGLGESVVGVTRYCNFPPETAGIPRIGGYYDPNYEVLLALKPDLVILLPEHERPREYLTGAGIRTLVLNQSTVQEIFATIRAIGRTCAVPERAETLIQSLQRRIDIVKEHTRGLEPASIMVVVGRDISAGTIKDLVLAGSGGWYNELIADAGGVNVYTGNLLFPAVSAEGVINMNPDVIADMLGDLSGPEQDPARLLAAWQSLPQVKAVQAGRVHPFLENYAVIPGPRFVLVLEALARILQPQVDWDTVLAAVESGESPAAAATVLEPETDGAEK